MSATRPQTTSDFTIKTHNIDDFIRAVNSPDNCSDCGAPLVSEPIRVCINHTGNGRQYLIANKRCTNCRDKVTGAPAYKGLVILETEPGVSYEQAKAMAQSLNQQMGLTGHSSTAKNTGRLAADEQTSSQGPADQGKRSRTSTQRATNDVLIFSSLGQTCPLCGKKMRLVAGWWEDPPNLSTLEWRCDHDNGNQRGGLIIALHLKDITRDELDVVIDVVRGYRSGRDLPNAATEIEVFYNTEARDAVEKRLKLFLAIREMSNKYGIDLVRHYRKGVFKWNIWFRDFLSRIPDHTLERYADEFLGKTDIDKEIRMMIEDELWVRRNASYWRVDFS